jgi:peptide/nickel transport system ATP-binding protein
VTKEGIVLSVRHLKTYFSTEEGTIKAVDDVSFDIGEGQTLGLVGESGCGKSVTALSIMRLVDAPAGKIMGGEIIYRNRDLLQLSEKQMRKIRGNEISMIFQEPMTSMNPVFTIGNQLVETIMLHQRLSSVEATKKAAEMLAAVKISDPVKRLENYPHQLSGGMLQRIMIAMAISCTPTLLIADEPTTALDVTIQAQILSLLADLKRDFRLSLLLITHDLGIVAEVADRIAVMYAGTIIEEGDALTIFTNPCHPYTLGLMKSIPRIDSDAEPKSHLCSIPGTIPNPLHLPSGCCFEPRCSHRLPICSSAMPPILNDGAHLVRCYLYEKAPLKSKILEESTATSMSSCPEE